MKKWKTGFSAASIGLDRTGYCNQVIAPNGTVFTVNFQDVIHGDIKTEPLPVSHYGPGYVQQTIINRTGNKPEPDSLCEFIVAACNAASH